jgi:uncharacterized membrane protein YeaQ/YmgE (transglycosylase-associated protein family)
MERTTIFIGLFLGGMVGSYLPVALSGSGWFSLASIIGGFVGSVVGMWLGWRLTVWIDS